MEVNGFHQLYGYQYSSKYLFIYLFIFVQRREETHTVLEQVNDCQWIFHFWSNYPFLIALPQGHLNVKNINIKFNLKSC